MFSSPVLDFLPLPKYTELAKLSYQTIVQVFSFDMSFTEQVKQLTVDNINEIEVHYYAALETEHGSGEHWILMTVLDKHGFRTNSPMQAMNLADEIIMAWYTQKK